MKVHLERTEREKNIQQLWLLTPVVSDHAKMSGVSVGTGQVLRSILELLSHGEKTKLPHQQVWRASTCQADTCGGLAGCIEQNWPHTVVCSVVCKELADPRAHCSQKEVTGGMNFQVHPQSNSSSFNLSTSYLTPWGNHLASATPSTSSFF